MCHSRSSFAGSPPCLHATLPALCSFTVLEKDRSCDDFAVDFQNVGVYLSRLQPIIKVHHESRGDRGSLPLLFVSLVDPLDDPFDRLLSAILDGILLLEIVPNATTCCSTEPFHNIVLRNVQINDVGVTRTDIKFVPLERAEIVVPPAAPGGNIAWSDLVVDPVDTTVDKSLVTLLRFRCFSFSMLRTAGPRYWTRSPNGERIRTGRDLSASRRREISLPVLGPCIRRVDVRWCRSAMLAPLTRYTGEIAFPASIATRVSPTSRVRKEDFLDCYAHSTYRWAFCRRYGVRPEGAEVGRVRTLLSRSYKIRTISNNCLLARRLISDDLLRSLQIGR